MTSLLALALALQAREEVVAVPKTDVRIAVVHVPVGGTALRPYALGKYETRWAEFLAYYDGDKREERLADGLTRPSKALDLYPFMGVEDQFMTAKAPVVGIHWHTAMAYCDWLTAKTGRKFRLPTEAEWEHAAKGDVSAGARHAGSDPRGTRPVTDSKPNVLGLHDLLGNVWETCLEPMDPPRAGPVYRGGAWNTPADRLTPGLRTGVLPEWFEADPTRPRSLWWLFTGGLPCSGLRPALVGDAEATAASLQYSPKVAVKILGAEERPPKVLAVTVRLEAANGGECAIDELEVQVFPLDRKGEPHLLEMKSEAAPLRPNLSWSYPVLVSSGHEAVRKPLAPGEFRSFKVDLPLTFSDEVKEGAFGARVTWVRLAAK
jgi:hypothetical protein